MPGHTPSPIVSTESVLLTEKIDAHEVRDVRICDTLVENLSTDMHKDMKMALRGRLSELMVNISPQIYRQHTIYEKGSSVLYVTLKKALYRCLRSALLIQ